MIPDILEEIRLALAAVDEAQERAFADALAQASDVFVTGRGRSGLMAAAFAVRLVHLGKRAHVVGAPTTPAVTKGALVVACSGSGRTRCTAAHAEQARAAGAQVWALTQEPSSPLAAAAHHALLIPAVRSAQPGGSAFEQALLVFLDSVVLRLMATLGETPEAMRLRHTNLE